MPKRTAVYIDGFNLYYGALKGTPYKWLDIQALWGKVLSPVHQVVSVKYFTAKVADSPLKPGVAQRQQTYLDALAVSCPCVSVVPGHYTRKRLPMENANPPPHTVEVWRNEEKGSDVALAVHLLNDAWSDTYDVGVVVSNDADLVPAVELVVALGKQVMLVAPGFNRKRNARRRPNDELRKAASHARQLRDSTLADSQLPDAIAVPGGGVITKPQTW